MKIQNKANQTNVVKNNLQGTFEDFNKIVDAYPNKECLKVAKKVYFSQFKQGNLPSCLALLEIIEKFKQSDSRWKNGYVPMLKNFLRFERYKEEPLVREQKSFVFEDKNTPKEEKNEENIEQLRAKFDQSRFDKPLENYLTYKTKTLSPDQAERVSELNKKWADKIGRNPEIEGYIKAIFANSNNPEGYLRFAEDTLHYSKEKIELSLSNFIKKHKNIFKPFILEDYLEDIEEEEEKYLKTAVSY